MRFRTQTDVTTWDHVNALKTFHILIINCSRIAVCLSAPLVKCLQNHLFLLNLQQYLLNQPFLIKFSERKHLQQIPFRKPTQVEMADAANLPLPAQKCLQLTKNDRQ